MNRPDDNGSAPLARIERIPPAVATRVEPPAVPPPGFVTLLLRQWRLMLALFLAILTAGLATLSLAQPRYTARVEFAAPPASERDFLLTETRRLAGAALRETVVATHAAELADTQSPVRKLSGWTLAPAEILADATRARSVPPLLVLEVTLPDPGLAARIADELGAAYLARQAARSATRRADEADRTRAVGALAAEVAGQAQRIDGLRRQLQVLSPEPLVADERAALADLARRRDELDLRIRQAEGLREIVTERVSAMPEPTAADVRLGVERDPRYVALSRELEQARTAHANLADRFGPAHPELRARARQIEELLGQRETLFAAIEAELRPQMQPGQDLSVERRPDRLALDLADLRQQRAALDALLAARRDAFREEFALAAELVEAEREAEEKRFALATARSTPAEVGPPLLELVTPAEQPHRPDRDDRPLIGLVSALLAAGVALAGGTARVLLTGGLRQMDHREILFAEEFGAPLGLMSAAPPRAADEFALRSESTRMVRTALLERLPSDGAVVQVTSAGPRAGKTTVAIELARSLAEAGRRTLLVDADLRNPGIARRVGLVADGQGLVAALATESAMPHQAVPVDPPGLSVLPLARPVTADEAAVLRPETVRAVFSQWRTAYDVIVVDSSPVLPVADARVLAQAVDGTVLVVREQHCERDDVFEAVAYLRAAGGRMLGTVFNAGRRSLAFHGAYHYRQAYAGERFDGV